MRVMALMGGMRKAPTASELYRINQPLYFLGKSKEWQVSWNTLQDVFADWYLAASIGKGAQRIHETMNGTDIIVLPRISMDERVDQSMLDEFFSMCHFYGIKTVYEVDDDMTNVHRNVLQHDMASVVKRCDAVTVTTSYLGKTMQDAFDKPTYVLPNLLDPAVWRNDEVKRNLSEDRPLIFLSGSTTHQQDWKVLAGVFPALLKKHPEAVVVICGFHPDYLANVDGVVYMDGVNYAQYAQVVRQSDIILAPVDPEDGFNMGKSPIKATEGMGAVRKIQNQLCGAAVIATNNPIYRLAVKDGHDGLLVEHTPDAWLDAMDKVLTDVPFRRRLQQNAYNTVWKKGHWDMSRKWGLWADAYKKIASSKRKVINQFAPVGEGVI